VSDSEKRGSRESGIWRSERERVCVKNLRETCCNMHDSRMFGVKSQHHQQQQLLLGYCAGGKKLLWRLPCLCLVAAILAFTLGFFTAPFVGSARSAVSVGDPLWQMYYIRHKGSTFKPAVRDGGLQQFQQQEAEEAEIEEEEGDFKLQPREADLRFGKQGESVQQRRQGSHEIQGPLDFAAEVVEPALESDKHEGSLPGLPSRFFFSTPCPRINLYLGIMRYLMHLP
jgi:hypothetical protein